MATTSPLLAVKAALTTVLAALYGATAQVTYGDPTAAQLDDQVLLSDARVSIERVTSVHFEHTIELDVLYDSWRFGAAEQQQVATEAALALLELLADYLDSSDRTLGGACRHSMLSSYELMETEDPDDAATGRRAVVKATVTAYVRV